MNAIIDKTIKREIHGKTYSFLCSVRSMQNITKKFGSLEEFAKTASKKDSAVFEDLIWIFVNFLNSAEIFLSKQINNYVPTVYDEDYFLDVMSVTDMALISDVIFECFGENVKRTIKSEPTSPKKKVLQITKNTSSD